MHFSSSLATAYVTFGDDDDVNIQGQVTNPELFSQMRLIAPHPPTRGVSYAGAALPFPCPNIAFDNTPNIVDVAADGHFGAVFKYPNSYYSYDNKSKVVSSIFLVLVRAPAEPLFVRFELPDRNVLRSLTHRPERALKGPAFYTERAERIGIASQYDIISKHGNMKETHGTA